MSGMLWISVWGKKEHALASRQPLLYPECQGSSPSLSTPTTESWYVQQHVSPFPCALPVAMHLQRQPSLRLDSHRYLTGLSAKGEGADKDIWHFTVLEKRGNRKLKLIISHTSPHALLQILSAAKLRVVAWGIAGTQSICSPHHNPLLKFRPWEHQALFTVFFCNLCT